MNHEQTPLFEAIQKHNQQRPISFHVPGHKNGQIFSQKALPYFQEIMQIDVTELTGLDDLHAPESAIKDAEELLADAYRTSESFFLINGSTVGNLTMIMASFNEDDIIFVQRNCHKSVLHGLKLAKLQPIFIEPEFNEDWKVATGISTSSLEAAYQKYPMAKGIILTYPNYYGFTYDLKAIIALCHAKDMTVLVDEAHGAHFIAGDPFPPSAIQLGADMVVQSAHKTLPAMTMAAFLHLNSRRINRDKLGFLLQALQSSSPSYPLMASLDLARNYIATYNKRDMDSLVEQRSTFINEINEIEGIKVLTHKDNGDILKIAIQSTNGMSGFELQTKLETVGIYPELADPYNVLLIFPLLKRDSIYEWKEIIQRFKNAFLFTEKPKPKNIVCYTDTASKPAFNGLSLNYKEQTEKQKKYILLSHSVGKSSAEMIIPYPPGIPLIMEGEAITVEKINELQQLIGLGARFHGGEYLHEQKIKVFE
jgi:arginine/lysine/ornithine decarboxylase